MKTIYVLGSLNMDLVIQTERLPKKGETIVGNNFRTCPGGKGLNQSIAASKLGGNVKMLGATGDDFFGLEMIKALKENKVDTENIRVFKGKSSGIAQIFLINGDNRIILDLGANVLIEKQHVDLFLKNACEDDIFLTQCENNLEVTGYALHVAKTKKMITVVNPAPANKELLKYIFDIDILVPNEIELETLFGTNDIHVVYAKFGIKNILVTLGDKGYFAISNGKTFEGKAKKVKVIDTTGAGDCFVGALCYQLSLNNNLNKKIADFACNAATISVTRSGSSVSSPTAQEMK